MPPIYNGSIELTKLYLQNTELSKVYVGSEEVYPNAAGPVTSNLKMWLDCRDLTPTSTIWNDRSGNNYNCTINGGATSTTGWNKTIKTQYVYNNTNMTLGQNMTFEVYGSNIVNVNQNNYQWIMACLNNGGTYDGFWLGFNGPLNNKPNSLVYSFWISNNIANSKEYTNNVRAKHLVVTSLNNTISLYLDGVLKITGTQNISSLSYPLFLTVNPLNFEQATTGNFNTFRIYNQNLTAQEVLRNYNYNVSIYG